MFCILSSRAGEPDLSCKEPHIFGPLEQDWSRNWSRSKNVGAGAAKNMRLLHRFLEDKGKGNCTFVTLLKVK